MRAVSGPLEVDWIGLDWKQFLALVVLPVLLRGSKVEAVRGRSDRLMSWSGWCLVEGQEASRSLAKVEYKTFLIEFIISIQKYS